jgi:Xaa-Pro aminopeptidase
MGDGAWITLEREPFFTAPRMAADYELRNEAGWPVRILEDDGHSTAFLKQIADELGLAGQRVAIEDRAWSQFLIDFLNAAPTVELTVASEVMAPVRAIKGPEELEMLRKASEITDRAFGEVVKRMRLGDCEVDIAAELDHQIRQLGSEPSMTTAVLGWGEHFPRQALDRDYLTGDSFTPGTVVDFDFGAIYEGYCTDFGRVVHFWGAQSRLSGCLPGGRRGRADCHHRDAQRGDRRRGVVFPRLEGRGRGGVRGLLP